MQNRGVLKKTEIIQKKTSESDQGFREVERTSWYGEGGNGLKVQLSQSSSVRFHVGNSKLIRLRNSAGVTALM